VRTAGLAGSARAAGRCLAGDGGVLKIACRIWEVGVAGSPVIGRRPGGVLKITAADGLRASSDGVLATKSVCTRLYSLIAWSHFA